MAQAPHRGQLGVGILREDVRGLCGAGRAQRRPSAWSSVMSVSDGWRPHKVRSWLTGGTTAGWALQRANTLYWPVERFSAVRVSLLI